MIVRSCAALIGGAVLVLATGCSQPARTATDAARPPVPVDTARAGAADFIESVDVVGTLTPKYEADIKSEYTGTVTEVLVSEWVAVRKGQVLARLDTREAKAQLVQVEAQASRAQREYERALKLKEAGLMTAQGLEEAQTQRDAANALLDLANAKFDKLLVRSPMDGVISYRGVSAGDRVESMGTGGTMFHVMDTRMFDLRITVASGRIGSVKAGQVVAFTTDAVPGRTFGGKVAFINPGVEAESKAVQVVVEVPNPSGELKAGLFVKGRIDTRRRTGVLQVPKTALVTWDVDAGKAECFVVTSDRAARRAVTTGAVCGELVEVTSGLEAGDVVVTRGAFNLQDGDAVAVKRS